MHPEKLIMKKTLVFQVFLLIISYSALGAAQEGSGTLALAWDNDLFTGTDMNYTNGVRLSWLGEKAIDNREGFFGSVYSQTLKNIYLFLFNKKQTNSHFNASIALQHLMITPDDIYSRELIPNQAPYVGILNLETSLFVWNKNSFKEFGIEIGTVGPESGAEGAQKLVHELTGSDEPRGWSHQVGSRTTFGVSYIEGNRLYRSQNETFNWDLTAIYSLSLGNFESAIAGGGVMRWGKNLPYTFNSYYGDLGSASSLLGMFDNIEQGYTLYPILGLLYK